MQPLVAVWVQLGENGTPVQHVVGPTGELDLSFYQLQPCTMALGGLLGFVHFETGHIKWSAEWVSSKLAELGRNAGRSAADAIVLTGDPAAGCIPKDSSHSVCAQLLQQPVALPALDDLQAFLAELTPAAKLPLSPTTLANITPPELAACFTTLAEQPAHCIYIDLEGIMNAQLNFHDEQLVAQAVDRLFTGMVMLMDILAPTALGLQLYRDAGDGNSNVTMRSATGRPLRPDCQLRARDGVRLLYKGEEKAAGGRVADAVSDLARKTQAWTPLYYGDLPYLLCHAAAGPSFQLYAISKATLTPVAISDELDMSNPEDRLKIVQMAIQLYRLLRASMALLPPTVLPVDKLLTQSYPSLGYKRTLLYKSARLTVIKCIQPFSTYASLAGVDFALLQQVYAATKGAVGLVHAAEGPLLEEETDCYKVELAPLGRNEGDAEPQDGAQLCSAAYGLLSGLAAMHEAGFCHRDVRWPNVACDYERRQFFWLDLEMAAPLDSEAAGLAHLEGVLVGGKYTAASDIYRLGCLLDEARLYRFQVSDPGCELLECLKRPAGQQLSSARQLLGHRWFTE